MKKTYIFFILFLFSIKVYADNLSSCNKIPDNDLVTIGKVWGFLKYHHPAVTSGKKDWDQELLKLLDRINVRQDCSSLNSILERWVDELGPVTVANQKPEYKADDIKLMPDNDWILDTARLSKGLSSKLVSIESAKRPGRQYYFYDVSKQGLEMSANEITYEGADVNCNLRLLSLYRFWNIIQYFYPYKYAIGVSWDDILTRYVPVMIKPQTNKEYILNLMRLTAEVNDAHIALREQDWVFGKNYLPSALSVIENKVLVTDYYDKNLSLENGINVGDEILEINGVPVNKLLSNLLPYCSGVNLPTRLRIACDKIVLTDSADISLTISNSNGVVIKKTTCFSPGILNVKTKYQAKKEPVIIENNIAYIYLGSLKIDALDKKLPEILKTSGLILDLRGYPVDDSIYYLFDYLLPKEKRKFYQVTVPDASRPGCFRFQKESPSHFVFSELKKGNRYNGKVVVLVDEHTQSEAEMCAMMASVIPNVTIIGSQTAGTDGPAAPLYLPGNVLVLITAAGVYNPDRSETVQVGIKISEQVNRTIEGIRTGVDPLVKRGVEIIQGETVK